MPLKEQFDVVILGTGPAGLQAAIHASRKNTSVLVLGKESRSSLFNAHIENFCSIFKTTGKEIITLGRQQAAGFGAQFSEEDVLRIRNGAENFVISTENGLDIKAKTLIIATGSQRNRLGVPGEKRLLGKGVSYCVDCDGLFYRGKNVVVIGNASAAVDGALALVPTARQVTLVCQRLEVRKALLDRLHRSSVALVEDIPIASINGEEEVETVQLKDGTSIPAEGVFIELGAKGILQLATSLGVMLDEEMRFIQTDKQQATNIPGVYAAGDVCGPPWQMAKAVGEGCVAGINAAQYAGKIKNGKLEPAA